MSSLFRLLIMPLLIYFTLAVNAIVGVAVYFQPNLFGITTFVFAIFTALVAIFHLRKNLVFQVRIVLLITIGYYAATIKIIDPTAYFSPMELATQTFEIGARLFGLTSIAMLGAMTGLLLAGRQMVLGSEVGVGLNCRTNVLKPMFSVYVVVVIAAGYLSARSYGSSVFEAAYASESEGQLLGNLQSIGVICLVMCFVAAPNQKPTTLFFLVLLAVYYLGWGIFVRGGRLDVLSGLLALFVAIPAARGQVVGFRPMHYIAFFFLALLMEAWGTLRGTLAGLSDSSESIMAGYQRLADDGIYHAGTISAIGTTFSNIIHMRDNNIINLLYGNSYLDFILRTPPEFLYANRPIDLSSIFSEYDYVSGGGIFELGEAYLNFGIVGCLIVPFFISSFIATLYKKAWSGNVFWFFIFTAILSVYFRGAWYQTFAFYKSFFTGLVLYISYLSIFFLLYYRKNK